MRPIQDITKLCFLPGSLLPLKDGKYPYMNLLKLGLTNLGITWPSPTPVDASPKTISTSTYTLLETDVNNIYTNVAGCTITVPAGIALSHSSHHTCTANADLTFDADGTTINNFNGDNSSNGQYAVATLFQSSQDVFILGGNTKTV